jgi:hypothetical protein
MFGAEQTAEESIPSPSLIDPARCWTGPQMYTE